jgi:hypothetical protein
MNRFYWNRIYEGITKIWLVEFKFGTNEATWVNWNSLVSRVTGYELDDRGYIPRIEKFIFSFAAASTPPLRRTQVLSDNKSRGRIRYSDLNGLEYERDHLRVAPPLTHPASWLDKGITFP